MTTPETFELRSEPIPVLPLNKGMSRFDHESRYRLLGAISEGFDIEMVIIGSSAHDGKEKTWEGRPVEKGHTVTVCVHNRANETKACVVTLKCEKMEPLVDRPSPPLEIPAVPTVVNAGAPHAAPQTHVSTTIGNEPAYHAAVPVGQFVPAVAGPPPPNMAPGTQFVQQVSGPPAPNYPHNPPAPPMSTISTGPTPHMHGGYTQVGGSSYVQAGGTPQGHYAATASQGHVVVLLSRDAARKVANSMRGQIYPQSEMNVCENALQQAIDRGPSSVTPGANEVAIVLSRDQATRALSIAKGTDHHDVAAIQEKFDAVNR